MIYKVTWREYEYLMKSFIRSISPKAKKYTYVSGVPRGGLVIATHISNLLGIPYLEYSQFLNSKDPVLLCDDLCETGGTLLSIKKKFDSATLFLNKNSKFKPNYYGKMTDKKIMLPWEIN